MGSEFCSFLIIVLFLPNESPIFAQQNISNSINESLNNNGTDLLSEKVNVSILPGASLLTETAYDPNPVEITTGQTILWTNDDTAFHTVTSSEVGEPDSSIIFDSGLNGPSAMINKGKTFEHTFDPVGEYPYYCILHPGMVDYVIWWIM